VVIGPISDPLVRRLRWHAGLVDEGPGSSTVSVSACIDWAGVADERLEAAIVDFMDALSELNLELNGPRPSHSVTRSALVPRDVVYAVAEVIRLIRDVAGSGAEAVAASDAAWSIETGWRAVLAGDVDDIAQHVAEEKEARRSS
jgi:hypothetical protein